MTPEELNLSKLLSKYKLFLLLKVDVIIAKPDWNLNV